MIVSHDFVSRLCYGTFLIFLKKKMQKKSGIIIVLNFIYFWISLRIDNFFLFKSTYCPKTFRHNVHRKPNENINPTKSESKRFVRVGDTWQRKIINEETFVKDKSNNNK